MYQSMLLTRTIKQLPRSQVLSSQVRTTMSKSPTKQITRSSICNCKQVEVSVTGVSKGSVLCHCSNCQKATGSAFAYNYRFMPGELKFVKGKDVIREYPDTDTKSGNTLNRNFCTNCGCPMFLTNPAFKGFVILHGGSIQGERVEPSFDLFPDNKQHWVGNLTSKSKM